MAMRQASRGGKPSESNTTYEIALFGEFFSKDLPAIMNRITLHSESAHQMHTREIVFEPFDAHVQREKGVDPILLRARKELLEPDAKWVFYSYLKPESVRVHPDATVRPWATVQVQGDILSFASTLGYVRRSQIYKRGYVFRRGALVIQMFQQEKVDEKTEKPIPAHQDTLWEVEVKTATPVTSSKDKPLSQYVDSVLEVQLLMKGLLDLRRKDA
ncbi:unnamed protein product [Somion occarium]|uniref:Mediator of RNA polymerase II transcription subunit 18 n=1 Tax=Somion occarium TaxID=3059160 RepID=A0ABP1D172_9APHY